MGRTAKTAMGEKLLPLPLQFLGAWIGMWVGEQQAREIEYCHSPGGWGQLSPGSWGQVTDIEDRPI